jgi:hypothetical protein
VWHDPKKGPAAAIVGPAADAKGLTIMSNSIYNGWRFEDLWLDN